MRHPAEEQIRDHAYRLWEAAGKPADREEEFWYEAQRQLSPEAGEKPCEASRASNPDEKSTTFIE